MRRFSVVAFAALAALAACDGGTEPDPEVTITSISPALLTSGVTMVIEGTGFSSTASENQVTLAGTQLEVASATSTELRLELGAGSIPCGVAGDAEVVVAVAERQASAEHPAEGDPATSRSLAAGEFVRLVGNDRLCNELTEPGRYLITVFNTTTSPTAISAFRLRGAATGPDVMAAPADPSYTQRQAYTAGRTFDPGPEVVSHLRMLERNIDLAQRLGVPGRQSSRLMPSSVAPAAAPPLGTLRTFRIPDIDQDNACTNYIEVDARAVYAGTRGVIFEDTLAPLAGSMSDSWQELGQEFDDVMYQVLLDNFGDPLVLDDQLDNDDRVLMLFSEEINNLEGNVAGFVFSGDMFERQQCESSDLGEIFYGIVPTEAGSGFQDQEADNPDTWLRGIRSTVIHEAKHITSFAHRIANGATALEEGWLEESTARISEELYARAVFGYTQMNNTTYEESIHCEVRPGFQECGGQVYPYVMAKHFDAVETYYRSIESLSPIGPVDDEDFTYYGSGWLLVRWAIDHAASEADFLKALVSETSSRGVANLAARTGRSFPEMLADFSLAAALDDRPSVTVGRSELAVPSWNTRDIFAGFNSDFPQSFTDPTPLNPRAITSGSFDVRVDTIRGGTASIFELSGTSQSPQSIELQGAAGGAPPAALDVAIVRIQ